MTENKRRLTIAVDVDGVIADYCGWQGEEHIGSPRLDVIQALTTLREAGWKIIVHTTRGADRVARYLEDNKVPYDEVNANSDYANAGPKPVATVYWDDRALRYSGNAVRDLTEIMNFSTWSGRI